MRVLIGYRDALFLDALQLFLEDCGHETAIATNGLECSGRLNTFVPDIVVLDRDLLWGGYQGVIAKMAEDPLLWETPVIQIWSTIYDVSHESRWQPPLIGRLQEPFRMNALLKAVVSTYQKSGPNASECGTGPWRRNSPMHLASDVESFIKDGVDMNRMCSQRRRISDRLP